MPMLSNPNPATVFPPSSLNADLYLEPCGYHWELTPHARSFLDTILSFYSAQIQRLKYGDGECPAQSHSLSQPGPDSPAGIPSKPGVWASLGGSALPPCTSAWYLSRIFLVGWKNCRNSPCKDPSEHPLLEAHTPPHQSTSPSTHPS